MRAISKATSYNAKKKKKKKKKKIFIWLKQ